MPEDEEREGGREVVRYGGKVIYVHWAVVIVFLSLVVISVLLLRDWYWETFKIRGTDLVLATPGWGTNAHLVLAVLLLLLGMVHVLLHVKQESKPILPKDVMADFQASVHTLKYTFFMSTWDDKTGAAKYRGNQRMTYVITFYVIALAALTGVLARTEWMGEVGTTVHVVAGVMVLLVFIYRMVYTFKKREWIAWRSIFITGMMPAWYVRQNHPKWYEEIEGPTVESEGPVVDEEPPEDPGTSKGDGARPDASGTGEVRARGTGDGSQAETDTGSARMETNGVIKED